MQSHGDQNESLVKRQDSVQDDTLSDTNDGSMIENRGSNENGDISQISAAEINKQQHANGGAKTGVRRTSKKKSSAGEKMKKRTYYDVSVYKLAEAFEKQFINPKEPVANTGGAGKRGSQKGSQKSGSFS